MRMKRPFGHIYFPLLLFCGIQSKEISHNQSYKEIQQENEALKDQVVMLERRIRQMMDECDCPTDQCEHGGRQYRYRQTWVQNTCERCTCAENGVVSCRFDSTAKGCSDTCASNPCYNGATCRSGRNGSFECICLPDCSGRLCEEREAQVCSQPLNIGKGCEDVSRAAVIWYYEQKTDSCVETLYLGCGGNSNRFTSQEACISKCTHGTCCYRQPTHPNILYGHSPDGYDRYGFRQGRDENGGQATPDTATAAGDLRYRFNGVDYKGYRSDGYNQARYPRSGYNCQGVDNDGFDMDGLATELNYTCMVTSRDDCLVEVERSAAELIAFEAGRDCGDTPCGPIHCNGCVHGGNTYQYEETFTDGCHQCICTRTGAVQCSCTRTIQRKEIRDLTAVELAAYQTGIQKLYKEGIWADFAEMYSAYIPHSHGNAYNYLPWHRAMLARIEVELHRVTGSCDIAIPYVDWTMDIGLMEESPLWRAGIFAGNGDSENDCVKYHPYMDLEWSPCLRRQFNTSMTLPDAVQVEQMLRNDDFSHISEQLKMFSSLFRQTRGKNYLALDPDTRYKPLRPFERSADDVNNSPVQLCIEFAPLGSLCNADHTGSGRPYSYSERRAFDKQGYDSSGFDRFGFNRDGFNGDGFDKEEYDRNGFNRYGFNREGVSKIVQSSKVDSSILDKQNFTKIRVDVNGLDLNGRDIYGYDSRGFDRNGCNAHFQDGYNYVKQKFELDLDLKTMNNAELARVARICSGVHSPPDWWFTIHWVITLPRYQISGRHSSRERVVYESPKQWNPQQPDSRFCLQLNLYSGCELGETPLVSDRPHCGVNLCLNAECPSFTGVATCRVIGCDNTCRKEWYHNGQVVTSSCTGCRGIDGVKYDEGDSWSTPDGCRKCSCVAGQAKCSGCPPTSCTHPVRNGCCPSCDRCSYDGQIYASSTTFGPETSPCELCQCQSGSVTCQTKSCPALIDCARPVTMEGACCPTCMTCEGRTDGERWYESDCELCECRDGQTRCTPVTCGPSQCAHPIKIPGICCPQCKACSYEGAYYHDGQIFSPDNCQRCECNTGDVICTTPECPQTSCAAPYLTPGSCCPTCDDECKYDGKSYDEGEVFTPSFNPCMNCSCAGRKVRCGRVSCPPTPELQCGRPVALPGECCPSFCPSCMFEGQEYRNDDQWSPSKRPCDICLCYNGVVSCRSKERCSTTCTYGVFEGDSCCSTCTDCLLDDKVHKDGSRFLRTSDQGCSQCFCSGGNIQCSSYRECLILNCARPIQMPGTCCPICPTCVGGRKHNERWRSDQNQCDICQCKDGVTKCEPQQCPMDDRCLSLENRKGHCCPVCLDCVYKRQRYPPGIITDVTDPCQDCDCQDGRVSCERKTCPAINCANPEVLEGACCPVCVTRQCQANGEVYAEGQRFTNGCKNCVCRSGKVACVLKTCAPVRCTHPAPDSCGCPSCRDCELRGSAISAGQTYQDISTCSTCICSAGSVECSPIICPDIACQFPGPGVCCPTCDSCLVEGIRYTTGEVIQQTDECNKCECQNGEMVCKPLVDCPPVDCINAVQIDCCLQCPLPKSTCDVDGIVYLKGEMVPNDDECKQCLCENGQVKCVLVECTPANCENPTLSDCGCLLCPEMLSCEYNGIIYEQGEAIPQDNECEICTCLDGLMECQDIACPIIATCESTRWSNCGCLICAPDISCEYRGVAYEEGDVVNQENECELCTCLGGLIECNMITCPAVTCTETNFSSCGCSVCAGEQCTVGEDVYQEGDAIPQGDCEICLCTDGNIECYPTSKDCPEVICPETELVDCCPVCRACDVGTTQHHIGDTFDHSNGCDTCTCLENGTVACQPKLCPAVNCQYPATDGCCPVCGPCEVNGIPYKEGDSIPTDTVCENCLCAAGDLLCRDVRCPDLGQCLTLTHRDGECCPVCEDCFIDMPSQLTSGTRRRLAADDELVDIESCTTCTCSNGDLTCLDYVDCPLPECTSPDISGCCPQCDKCTYQGQMYRNGESFADPDNMNCSVCTCRDGDVTCISDPCPLTCEGSHTIDECGCPICSMCMVDGAVYGEDDQWTNSDYCLCTCEEGIVKCETCDTSPACAFTDPDPSTCCGVKCKTCTVENISYQSGATWSQDGCRQTCTCNGGLVTCIETLGTCHEEQCYDTASPVDSCCRSGSSCSCHSTDGIVLNVGDSYRMNTSVCAVCTCVQPTFTQPPHLLCMEPVCPSVAGCPKERLRVPEDDSCCPVCENAINEECIAENEGELISMSHDPCSVCECRSNTWMCSEHQCSPIDCPLTEMLTEPGECCPTCAGCYSGEIRQNHGSSWQDDTDPCATCKCHYGEIICEETVVCPPLFCTEDRKPFTPEGQCCQLCGDPVIGDSCLDIRGKARTHGSGWSLDDCTSCECLYGKVTCTSEDCPRTDCKADETLIIEEGICCPECVVQPAVCKVYGDPHYLTLDGETVHFQGFCSYVMMQECVNKTFTITAIHDDRSTNSVSWIKGMIVDTQSLKIQLGQGTWVEVNGVNVTLPFQHESGVTIRQDQLSIRIMSDKDGFDIFWDGSAYSEVQIESRWKNKLCGLCGNFNDDMTDDLTTRQGTLTSSHAEFGDSWLVKESECTATEDIHPCDEAGYQVKKEAIEQCAIIQGDLFSPCHRAVPPEEYYGSCVYDLCACKKAEGCLCDALTAYSSACLQSHVRIMWRTPERCAMNCDTSKGFLFDECGPACPRTCENFMQPLGELRADCLKPCEPSCQCPAGLVQHNGRCVPTDVCP